MSSEHLVLDQFGRVAETARAFTSAQSQTCGSADMANENAQVPPRKRRYREPSGERPMKKISISMMLALSIALFGFGCKKNADNNEGAMESAGEEADEAAADVSEKTEEAGEDASDATEEAGDKIEDKTD
jgi:hypothetical protein